MTEALAAAEGYIRALHGAADLDRKTVVSTSFGNEAAERAHLLSESRRRVLEMDVEAVVAESADAIWRGIR